MKNLLLFLLLLLSSGPLLAQRMGGVIIPQAAGGGGTPPPTDVPYSCFETLSTYQLRADSILLALNKAPITTGILYDRTAGAK